MTAKVEWCVLLYKIYEKAGQEQNKVPDLFLLLHKKFVIFRFFSSGGVKTDVKAFT